jgi:hypothetical protein
MVPRLRVTTPGWRQGQPVDGRAVAGASAEAALVATIFSRYCQHQRIKS